MAVSLGIIGDTLDAIVTVLETALATQTTNVTVLQDSDETTQARILEIASRGVSVLVAWTGTKSGEYASKKSTIERFAAGIWAGPVPSRSKHRRTTSVRIASTIGRIVERTVLGNDWGVEGVHRAVDLQCDNLTGGTPDAEGYALSVVTWEQKIEFPPVTETADLNDLLSVYTKVDLDSPGAHIEDEFNTTISQV